jgi:hypothetical protein
MFDRAQALLQGLDLVSGIEQGRSERCGEHRLLEEGVQDGKDARGSQGNAVAQLAEQAADRIETGGARGEPGGAQAVQTCEDLLIDGLEGNGAEIVVAQRFEQGLGIGTIGALASAPSVLLRRTYGRTACGGRSTTR